MTASTPSSGASNPLILIVPGIADGGGDHWQAHWQRQLPDCARVELGPYEEAHRNTWVNRLNLAIHRAGRPVILVAHSLGCHAVAWWNEYERPSAEGPVQGALLVAPPDVEEHAADARMARFAPVMRTPMPFPTIVAASRDDPRISFVRARWLARIWKSRFVDAGWLGHLDAGSGVRDWPFGQFLLRQLKSAAAPLGQVSAAQWSIAPARSPSGRTV
jgi:predicted alpha/beta hydrolase family esterase